jgi:hypothetical protein
LPKAVTPPSLWNLLRENNLSGISRNRAGGMILGKEKPIPDERDGSSLKI